MTMFNTTDTIIDNSGFSLGYFSPDHNKMKKWGKKIPHPNTLKGLNKGQTYNNRSPLFYILMLEQKSF